MRSPLTINFFYSSLGLYPAHKQLDAVILVSEGVVPQKERGLTGGDLLLAGISVGHRGTWGTLGDHI